MRPGGQGHQSEPRVGFARVAVQERARQDLAPLVQMYLRAQAPHKRTIPEHGATEYDMQIHKRLNTLSPKCFYPVLRHHTRKPLIGREGGGVAFCLRASGLGHGC